jgi:hypothetical protein
MQKRTPLGNGYVRQMRVSTIRNLRTTEGIDQLLLIVCDCYVDSQGERMYSNPQEVESAIDDEQFDLGTARAIVEEATRLFTGDNENAKKN